MTERELVDVLARKATRSRTGILLVDRGLLGKEDDIAARSGMHGVDMAAFLAESLPEAANFVEITAAGLFDRLDHLASRPEGGDCLLVYNLDLPFAKVEFEDRQQLWRNLRDNLPYRQRALVLLMPVQAGHLLPVEDELLEWDRSSRLARLT